MSNASALFRSLLVYGLCLPLAVVLGYLLADPQDFTTFGVVGAVLFLLAIPLLLRWHHVWLIASWNMTVMLFFLPGKPQLWMGLAAVSLTISILQYALNRKLKFLHVPAMMWPLLFFIAVVLVTARLTGGIGFRALGGDTNGGKRYFTVLAAVVGYFAIINRRIPPQRAGLYVALFFLGGGTMAIANLPGLISPSFNFLFVLFPVADTSAFTDQNSVVVSTGGPTSRLMGLSPLGLAVYCVMLARYGIRGVLDGAKPWRMAVFWCSIPIALLGGFRGTLIIVVATFALLFYLDRLHHTRLLVPGIFVLLVGGGLLVLFAPRLPLSIQRTFAVLPFVPIDPIVRLETEASSEWRLNMWREVIPQIPQYLLVGKGYAFSSTELAQLGQKLEGIELVGNYHNGPLSVIIPFGIFGSIAFLWLMVAGIRTVYQNYALGDPAYHNINALLFAFFVVKVGFFFTVFGSLHYDLPMLLGLLALSISLNGGVAKPVVVPQPKIVFNRFKLHPSARRPAGA